MIAALVSVGLTGLANSILEASYAASRFPVPFIVGQTAFDASTIKSYYQVMLQLGTFPIYVRTQWLDFLFIGATSLMGLALGTLLARLHAPASRFRSLGIWFALAIPMAGLCDVVENVLSFVMLADPLGFPDWLAPLYSTAATVKFGFWAVGVCWLAGSLVALVITRLLRLITR
ncbi:MAG TPA: hypothetical protein VGE07_15115 [Herpetosiphonaceae bacterium]